MSLDRAVSEFMQTDVQVVDINATVSQVRTIMTEHALHHVPVLENERLVGMLSFTDLMGIGFGPDVGSKTPFVEVIDQQYPIEDLMESAMVTIGARQTLSEAAKRLSTGSFHSLPVVDGNGNLVGIITSTDLIRHLHDLLLDPGEDYEEDEAE
jgi:CBS domain-containing protein